MSNKTENPRIILCRPADVAEGEIHSFMNGLVGDNVIIVENQGDEMRQVDQTEAIFNEKWAKP